MERARPPRPSEDSGVETISPLPSTASLAQLVEAVRSPGVLHSEVNALLRGLAGPLAPDESPRARADLLLSLIESSYMSDMQGTDGRTVRSGAVQALLDLGYPYALELPPEALGELPRTRAKPGKQELPIVGLIATAVGLLAQSGLILSGLFRDLFEGNGKSFGVIVFVLGMVLGPALSATLGGWKRVRWLQRLGLLTMALTGSLWLVGFYTSLFSFAFPFSQPGTWVALISGPAFLLGAVLTRRPEWLARDKASDKAKTPLPPAP